MLDNPCHVYSPRPSLWQVDRAPVVDTRPSTALHPRKEIVEQWPIINWLIKGNEKDEDGSEDVQQPKIIILNQFVMLVDRYLVYTGISSTVIDL